MQDAYLNTSVNIKAVGDICPGDVSIDGFGILQVTKRYGPAFPLQMAGGLLYGADLLLGNFEGTLSTKCRNRAMRMCGLPEFASALKDAGFDAISVANNHVFDHGRSVFDETVSYLDKAGLKICGLRGKQGYYCEPVIFEKNHMSFGLLAYNYVGLEAASRDIGKYVAVVKDSVVNYTWNRTPVVDKRARQNINKKNRNVFEDIKKLKKEVDFVILLPHWGYEWTIYPPYGVVLEARAFIEAGADLILGCHPHVPQGIEKYRDGLIFYSLGNFLFDMCSSRFKNGMIADVCLSKKGIENYQYHFTSTNKNFQPLPAPSTERDACARLLEKSSSAITADDAATRLDDELIYREYERGYNQLKLDKIRYLFISVFRQPGLIKPILIKTLNLLQLIMLRLMGKKIRW